MRQTFDETTDPSFGAKHLPLVRARMAEQGLDGLLVKPLDREKLNEALATIAASASTAPLAA